MNGKDNGPMVDVDSTRSGQPGQHSTGHHIGGIRHRLSRPLSGLVERVPTIRPETVIFPAMRFLIARPRLADRVLGRMRWGNPFDPNRITDPYAWVPGMLDDGYVTFHKAFNQWFILGYEEAQEVLRSKSFGVEARMSTLAAVNPYTNLDERSFENINSWLTFVDPPDHTRIRRLVVRWFTPGRIEKMRPTVERLVADLIDDLAADIAAGNPIEMMGRFAGPLPVNVIGDIIGIPADDWPEMKAISDDLAKVLDPIRGFDPDQINIRFAQFRELILTVAEQRRQEPTDDLMSVLVSAADDGDRLSEAELVSTVTLLLAAGHETTTGAIGNSIINLAANPDERARWRNDPGLTTNAVEELLRYDTPVLTIGRNALEDVEVGGRQVSKGQLAVLLLGVANRDIRRFPDADDLNLDRPDPQPLSFGHGIHHCIGAALARLELQVALPALIDALGDYTVETDTIEWMPNVSLRRPDRLVVTPS